MLKKAGKNAWSVVKRGNMFMLAIGLLLGTTFSAVVSSLANDVIMSAVSSLFNLTSVEQLTAGPVLIGKFLAALISFIIVSIIIFIGLWLTYIILESVKKRKEAKNPPKPVVVEEVKPTNEELILLELKKINELLSKEK
ncbi:MscL family protein [Mycoplasmopsis meleagridis]|uniref:Large-conductance mechanosensitive channel n=1 Tax=Mycoplasmopsis meleagridis ATCC 25294 TaxID=1264554 RepID=A0A0F5H0Y1_9BACT|nr:MscL family protein [Mycoplasmopsis meleagridis]KKB26785.1 Large-conductance mechanosensitive channel [Mycoplasmopsis meleagridis ATCC 25294]KUH47178.1 mechanosensitive ion channel protein MscL [Mycoplasmopsis meleagridis]VEU77319.1 large conductance mechanosensitive channel protein [Mycoplasmopsis meleagridis]